MFSDRELLGLAKELTNEKLHSPSLSEAQSQTIGEIVEHALSDSKGRQLLLESMFGSEESPLIYVGPGANREFIWSREYRAEVWERGNSVNEFGLYVAKIVEGLGTQPNINRHAGAIFNFSVEDIYKLVMYDVFFAHSLIYPIKQDNGSVETQDTSIANFADFSHASQGNIMRDATTQFDGMYGAAWHLSGPMLARMAVAGILRHYASEAELDFEEVLCRYIANERTIGQPAMTNFLYQEYMTGELLKASVPVVKAVIDLAEQGMRPNHILVRELVPTYA